MNKNEESITKMVRPNNIEGIEPHNLDVPMGNHGRKRSTTSGSQDSLEVLEVVNHLKVDYNENGTDCDNNDEEYGNSGKWSYFFIWQPRLRC